MTVVYEWLATASVWWWPRFADHLWQTTLFALVVLAASCVLRRGPAQWRHTFCLLASAKFIVPVTLFVFLAQETGIDSLLRAGQLTDQNSFLLSGISVPATTLASTYEVTVMATAATGRPEIYLALTAVWLTGTLSILLLWAIRRRRFMRSLRLGRSVRQGREWRALKQAQESLGMKSNVGLVISPLKIEPGVWRVWRPVVVLPGSMATLLDDDELEAIMLHEMIHIQRRDNLVGHLQLALCALLWFHPLVWFISRRLFDEREQACDERVMEVSRAPEAYASSILKVVRFCFGWRVAGVIGAASGTNLRRRIENIMSNGNAKRGASGASRLLAVTLVGLALLFIVGAGIYNRPYAVNALGNETKQASTGNQSDRVLAAQEAEIDEKSSKKSKPAPPPPPPAEADIAEPPAPPTPPTPSTPPSAPVAPAAPSTSTPPARPRQPTQPATPAIEQEKSVEKPDKNKDAKEKTKSKEKVIGKLIEAPPPVYPEDAKKQKIEGTVVVAIVIGDDGNVVLAKAKSGPEGLYGASEEAATKARFKPTTVNGKPAKVAGAMTYNFVLDKE